MKYQLVIVFFLFFSLAQAQNPVNYSISDVEVERNQIEDRQSSNRSATDHRAISFTPTNTLSTPNPSREAVALYRFLQDQFGKQTLSGQMWVPWGINEINYVEARTGKKPAIAGFDYINEPANATENQRAIAYWNDGGIVTMMWHWGAPGVGEGYENSKAKIDINQCYIEGTPQNIDFWEDLVRIADWLEELKEANVPVLWRPFHELNGTWFWWSKGGPEQFKNLWITMYDYLVYERKLNNLIWVLCYTADSEAEWFPGNEYVDIAGADTYDNTTDSHLTMYEDVIESIHGNNYPIAFHENGNPPNPEECIVDGAMWSWWMTWHTSWLQDIEDDYLKEVYESHLVLTLDELPDIMALYNWDDDCAPSTITASIQAGNGDWRALNKIGKGEASNLKLRVESEDEGSWEWSGDGVSNNPDNSETEQLINTDELRTVTAVFTNSCGAVTTQTFHVINGKVITGTQSQQSKASISLFPSPTSEWLTIDLGKDSFDKESQLEIIDEQGRSILKTAMNGNQSALDVSSLKAGVYLLITTNAENTSVHRFIKE